MKNIIKIGIPVILIAAVLAFTGYAYASAGSAGMHGFGGKNSADTPQMNAEGSAMQVYMAEAWAQVLEMNPEDVNALLDQGHSHLEIALQSGWTEADLPGLMQAAMSIAAANAQADGVITQEQAQFMLRRMNRMQNFGDCEDCEAYQHRFMWSAEEGQGNLHQNQYRNQDCENCEANQYQNMERNGCGGPGTYGPGTSGPNGQPEPASGGQSFGGPGNYGPGGQGGPNN